MTMTTLFNLFCPLAVGSFSLTLSIYLMSVMIFVFVLMTLFFGREFLWVKTSYVFGSLFSMAGWMKVVLVSGMVVLGLSNLLSLVTYSFPLTTTLSFNLGAAVCLWFSSIFIFGLKYLNGATVMPANSPWYLIPFLAVVEAISISVRPITLCFRLLANMTAGHVLLTLICKMQNGLWLLGSLFGILELMVCMVQAFVFLMLTSVYLEEAFSH